MFTDYNDIISLVNRPPMWWDGHGVPRYAVFGPELCGPYTIEIALLRVGCQGCDQTFFVASELDRSNLGGVMRSRPTVSTVPTNEVLDAWDAVGDFAYGDPPYHRCGSGNSMQAVPLHVVEFWVCEAPDHAWVRHSEHEGPLPALNL